MNYELDLNQLKKRRVRPNDAHIIAKELLKYYPEGHVYNWYDVRKFALARPEILTKKDKTNVSRNWCNKVIRLVQARDVSSVLCI